MWSASEGWNHNGLILIAFNQTTQTQCVMTNSPLTLWLHPLTWRRCELIACCPSVVFIDVWSSRWNHTWVSCFIQWLSVVGGKWAESVFITLIFKTILSISDVVPTALWHSTSESSKHEQRDPLHPPLCVSYVFYWKNFQAERLLVL